MSVVAVSDKPAHLVVADLGRRFGETWAVRHSTFTVAKGEFFGLLGPSGCGKSTTLNVVAGFLAPTEGDVTLAGRSLNGVPPHSRNTGMVFQDYALFPHLNVAGNVAFGLKLRRLGKRQIAERVDELLNLVGLASKGANLPAELSGGEQQRVALARALAVEPDVVLLDEPLSNLDARLRDQMRKEIRRILGEAGATVVFVTHDQAEAFSLCDRVAVMFGGHIRQLDIPRTIYRTPATPSIAEFIGEANLLPARVESVGLSASRLSVRVGASERQLEIPDPTGLVAGTEGHVLLRPEVVRLAAVDAGGNDGGDTALLGRVLRTDFLGPLVQYTVEVSGAILASVQFSNDEPLDIDQKVAIRWSATDAVFLTAEDHE